MDLVIQNKQKRMHYILPLTLLMTTMIFYYSKIQGTQNLSQYRKTLAGSQQPKNECLP